MNKKFKYKLFGRFRGRKRSQPLDVSYMNDYEISIKTDINKNNFNILDIGSGSGENAIHLSKLKPKSNIFTCEIFEDGNINLVNQIIKNNIKNIKLFNGNVLEFLDNINLDYYLNEVWILFPDPWPKIRHHKRRLINVNFLKIISSHLKKGGKIFIATDSASYTHSILNVINSSQDHFFWENQRLEYWKYAILNLPETKFFKKAQKSNRNSIIFELRKI